MQLHDVELERLVLCDFLFYNENFDHADSAFPVEAFYLESHRTVFKQMRDSHREFGAVDYPSLVMQLREKGKAQLIMDVLIPMLSIMNSYEPECAYMPLHVKTLLKFFVSRERQKTFAEFNKTVAEGGDAVEAQMLLEATLLALNSYLFEPEQEDVEEIAGELETNFLPTGYYDLDRQIEGMPAPGLIVVAARPSVGKSAFARGIIEHVSKTKRVYWYSQDQSRSQIYKLEATKQKLQIDKLNMEQKINFVRQVQNTVWHGNVELIDKPLPIGQLVSNIKLSMPDVVVVDYLQIVRSNESDEYDRITKVCQELKTLAFQMKIPIIALAQFNRQFKKGETPDMAWLRGSGQIEQDADMILAIERDTDDLSSTSAAQIHVLKNKVGPRTRVDLLWSRDRASFMNMAKAMSKV